MTTTSAPPSWLSDATQWPVVRRALAYAVVVGAVLISINHGDAILQRDITTNRLLKMGLTILVPYLVSTFSAVGAIRQMRRQAASAQAI